MRKVVVTIPIAVNSSGAATSYGRKIWGRVESILYVPDASTPLDTGADFVITGETTGVPIFTITDVGTAAKSFAPRVQASDVTGVATLYASGGTLVPSNVGPMVLHERIKVVTAQGGTSLLGTLHFVVEEFGPVVQTT